MVSEMARRARVFSEYSPVGPGRTWANFNPLIIPSLAANMDIMGRTSKYGVISYVTKYITRRGVKSGSPHVAAEKEREARLARAAEKGKGPMSWVSRWFKSAVAPGVISQIDVWRVNWGCPIYLSSRSFYALATKSELKAARGPSEVADAISSDQGGHCLRKTPMDRYEARGERAADGGPCRRPPIPRWGGGAENPLRVGYICADYSGELASLGRMAMAGFVSATRRESWMVHRTSTYLRRGLGT